MTCGEHGGPICQVAGCLGSLRHAQDQHAQQSVPCHVVVDVMIVHAARHGSPTRPALSILFLRFSCSSVGASTCTGSGVPPSAVPFCYTVSKFGEALILKVNSFDNNTGSFDLTSSGLHSISCLGKPFSKSCPTPR